MCAWITTQYGPILPASSPWFGCRPAIQASMPRASGNSSVQSYAFRPQTATTKQAFSCRSVIEDIAPWRMRSLEHGLVMKRGQACQRVSCSGDEEADSMRACRSRSGIFSFSARILPDICQTTLSLVNPEKHPPLYAACRHNSRFGVLLPWTLIDTGSENGNLFDLDEDPQSLDLQPVQKYLSFTNYLINLAK